jgi:hypothetical protein
MITIYFSHKDAPVGSACPSWDDCAVVPPIGAQIRFDPGGYEPTVLWQVTGQRWFDPCTVHLEVADVKPDDEDED